MQGPFDDRAVRTEYRARNQARKPDIRGDYFRDQTAIIHCMDFRRLKRKTQVFFDPENDHLCTRIEHVLHVATVAATICKGLDLDAELAHAIGVGHDIGHAPFGHAGEKVLDQLMKNHGGFIHELHGLRVVDHIANRGEGLNLTFAVRDGIATHCGERWDQYIRPADTLEDPAGLQGRDRLPATWEGCVVRLSDTIAYLGRDIEDALRLGIIKREQLPERLRVEVGTRNGDIIAVFVDDLIASSGAAQGIGFSDDRHSLLRELKDFNYENIYFSRELQAYKEHCGQMMRTLFTHLTKHFAEWGPPPEPWMASPRRLDKQFGSYLRAMGPSYEKRNEQTGPRIVADYIAGMTDDYALTCYRELVLPTPLRLSRHS